MTSRRLSRVKALLICMDDYQRFISIKLYIDSTQQVDAEKMHDGFAIRRNGTCFTQETQCGPTVSPFYACCPQGMYCANHYNQVCCDVKGFNCTSSVLKQPSCTDLMSTLYNNGGVDSGYFCCANNTFGYSVTQTSSDGCGDPGYQLVTGEISLQPLVQAVSSASLITITSTSSTATLTTAIPSTIGSSNHGDHRNIGVLVGAIIGGVLGLIFVIAMLFWIINRRHTKRATSKNDPNNDTFEITTFPKYSRVLGSDTRGYHLGKLNTSEVDGRPVCELPLEKDARQPPRKPVELP